MSRRLLFLAHRLPYPPNKGEKIRAWHMLNHLAKRFKVDLGCLVDDPRDAEHVPLLARSCAEVRAVAMGSRFAVTARALLRARPGVPLSQGWFYHPALAAWVEEGLRQRRWDAAFVYSSAMAPYLWRAGGLFRVLDMVDVDSAKWEAYAARTRGPMRLVWQREARTLLALERRAATIFDRTIFVSEPEARHFVALAPETADRVDWVQMGVDLHWFDPNVPHPNPFPEDALPIVFTGTMNYRPNIEAVVWFAQEVLPRVRARQGRAGFWIVGANPAPSVSALARLPGVRVTGTVPDVRPFLAHAAVAVAPLLIARGMQSKVLEAMAMARPVIASPQAFEGVRAVPDRDLLIAEGVEATVEAVCAVLEGRHPGLGERARAAVREGHDWSATLARLDSVFSLLPG